MREMEAGDGNEITRKSEEILHGTLWGWSQAFGFIHYSAMRAIQEDESTHGHRTSLAGFF
jgi:hypothetical protein